MIFYNNNYNTYYRNEYNNDNKLIYKEKDDGSWEKYEYTENGDTIKYNGNKNEEWHTKYIYDANPPKIYPAGGGGPSVLYKYKEKSDGSWIKYEYDKFGNCINKEMSSNYKEDWWE